MYIAYICYIEILCIHYVVPGVVNITDVRCGAVNLINQCNVEWNVSLIVVCAIGLNVDTYVCMNYVCIQIIFIYVESTYMHRYANMLYSYIILNIKHAST